MEEEFGQSMKYLKHVTWFMGSASGLVKEVGYSNLSLYDHSKYARLDGDFINK
jgi:hypothetical protein